MPFKKGHSGNPHGRPRKSVVPVVIPETINTSTLDDELLRIALTAKSDTPRVSAIRELYNRIQGTPGKAKQAADEITESTGRRLVELAELAQCQDCAREHKNHVRPQRIPEPEPRTEKPREPLVEPKYNPPLPQAIVEAQNEEDRKRMTTVLVKP